MHDSTLLFDLALVLGTAGVVALLFYPLKQPAILGYLLAGFLISPHTQAWFPLTVKDTDTVHLLAELGVIMLMFGLGLHFSLRKLVGVGWTAVSGGLLEVVVMFLLGYGIGKAFGWNSMNCLFLGSMLSMSSTTIIIKALHDMGLSKTRFAGMVFGILIVEDVAAIAILALMSGIAMTGSLNAGDVATTMGKLSVFMAVILVAGYLAVPRLIRFVDGFKSPEMLLIVVLALCFGVSMVALSLGYSVALGAFLIGAVVAETREHGKITALVEPVQNMFAAIFFIAIGMLIDPKMVVLHIWPIIVITAAVVIGKIVSSGIGTFAMGNDRRTSLRVGMSLAQIGEFSFIIASLGLTLKVTDDFLYPIAVSVSAITTLLTPYLVKASDPLASWFDRVAPKRLTVYLDVYTEWAGRLGKSEKSAPHVRQMFRRWTLQISLNLLLLSGILIATAWAGRTAEANQWTVPSWMISSNAVIWLFGTLFTLPILIGMLRKMRAISMAIAEIKVTPAMAGASTPIVRTIVSSALLSIGLLGSVLWILTLTSAILPPWPVLVALLALLALVTAVMWRSFISLYAKAQIQLTEAFTEQHTEPTPEDLGPPVLKDAQVHVLTLDPQSPATGKLIRELTLRSATGASIVGIERTDASVVNPNPDEELRANDRILILGPSDQIASAVQALGGEQAVSQRV